MDKNPNIIIYSNYLIFENRVLSFRKKQLFDITNLPKLIPINENLNCWLVNRKQLTIKKIKELIKQEEKVVDVSSLQWYEQIKLDAVFNL